MATAHIDRLIKTELQKCKEIFTAKENKVVHRRIRGLEVIGAKEPTSKYYIPALVYVLQQTWTGFFQVKKK